MTNFPVKSVGRMRMTTTDGLAQAGSAGLGGLGTMWQGGIATLSS